MSASTPFFEPPSFRVSVVLLAYNQADALRRAIAALEASQARDQFETIVVDCASSDGTRGLEGEFPGLQMLRLPHHIGAARALNIAVRTARAELVFFLSPDVEVLPGTVSTLADALDNDSEAIAACPLLTDAAGNATPRVYQIPDPANVAAPFTRVALDLTSQEITIEFPTLDALMVRKQFITAMNYFDQRYGHYWVDAEFAMQARRASKKIRLFPAIRAVLHPAADPLEADPLAAVDRVLGAAEFAGKYGGTSLGFRIGAAFSALGRFDFRQFSSLLSGQKLDGSQAG